MSGNRITKKAAAWPLVHELEIGLAGGNCIHRAGIDAGAAVGAGVGIDHKLIVALTDGLYGAGGFAGPARYTFSGNYMSHGITPFA